MVEVEYKTADERAQSVEISFNGRNVWRTSFIVAAAIAVVLLLNFVLDDGGAVIFTVLMAWFAAAAMEPAVWRLSKHMPRGLATAIVMLAFVAFCVLFFALFGRLLVDQIVEIIEAIPTLAKDAVEFVNEKFGQNYKVEDILTQLNLQPSQLAQYGAEIAGGVLGILGSVVGGLFGMFTLGLFTFYLSADGPRFRKWLASLFPPKAQDVAVNVWDTTATKTGNYVAARLILAFINGSTSAIVFYIIGMPYALALGIWTGIVAQFVPTIGTYISIILPVLVGLLSDNPKAGVLALIWALIYQQVENLTIEPRISARAVDVHPAFAFAAVMLGAALFGVAGALLAVPVSAMALALAEVYRKRYELKPEIAASEGMVSAEHEEEPEATT